MKYKKIEEDKYRWKGRKYPLFLPQYRFIFLKRQCEYWRMKFLPFFLVFRLLYGHYKIKYVMDIPASAEIGGGIRIEHIGGIVINPKAVLGKNNTILNGVLIGSQLRGKNKGTPTIGDNVWIGTNAIIVGKITIGNNVMIAAGSFVNFDVPDNSIVIGNPGKIFPSEDATKGYIINSLDE